MVDTTTIQNQLIRLKEMEDKLSPQERLAYLQSLNDFVTDMNKRMQTVLDVATELTPR